MAEDRAAYVDAAKRAHARVRAIDEMRRTAAAERAKYVAAAHDEGGLSYGALAEELEVSRKWVIDLVYSGREAVLAEEKRAKVAARKAAKADSTPVKRRRS